MTLSSYKFLEDYVRLTCLKLNPKKCSFVKQRIEYFGHVVTHDGIFLYPGKVEVVKNFSTPASPKELRSFLGLANYYRRFIKGYLEIARPHNAVTKKGVKFCWSESCAVTFNRLKRVLVSAPVLAFPNFNEQFCFMWMLVNRYRVRSRTDSEW